MIVQRRTRLQTHRNGITHIIRPVEDGSWLGLGWIGLDYKCWPENRWVFLRGWVLFRFHAGRYVVNIWKPWKVGKSI